MMIYCQLSLHADFRAEPFLDTAWIIRESNGEFTIPSGQLPAKLPEDFLHRQRQNNVLSEEPSVPPAISDKRPMLTPNKKVEMLLFLKQNWHIGLNIICALTFL